MEKIFDKEVEMYLLSHGVSELEVAKIRYAKLKEKSIDILESVVYLLRNDDFTGISRYVSFSPAGDGYGLENNYIDFGSIIGDNSLDIVELGYILEELKNKINKF